MYTKKILIKINSMVKLGIYIFLIFLLTFIFLFSLICADTMANTFIENKVNFTIRFRDNDSSYQTLGIYVKPKEKIRFEILSSDESVFFQIYYSDGDIEIGEDSGFTYMAPSVIGTYNLTISSTMGENMILNVFVMVPRKNIKGQFLNGYKIGKYPTRPKFLLSKYAPPEGFIEVTEENLETLVSPHFKLKQFLCKQSSNFPQYVVLREKLLLKLELILEKLNQEGYNANTLNILSGYRTPYYNKKLKNVKYSQHQYGSAVDFFIDEMPADGIIDDLNQDGQIDYSDATIIYDIIDKMSQKSWYKTFLGGLGKYKKTHHHGPFVHIDVRGYRARW